MFFHLLFFLLLTEGSVVNYSEGAAAETAVKTAAVAAAEAVLEAATTGDAPVAPNITPSKTPPVLLSSIYFPRILGNATHSLFDYFSSVFDFDKTEKQTETETAAELTEEAGSSTMTVINCRSVASNHRNGRTPQQQQQQQQRREDLPRFVSLAFPPLASLPAPRAFVKVFGLPRSSSTSAGSSDEEGDFVLKDKLTRLFSAFGKVLRVSVHGTEASIDMQVEAEGEAAAKELNGCEFRADETTPSPSRLSVMAMGVRPPLSLGPRPPSYLGGGGGGLLPPPSFGLGIPRSLGGRGSSSSSRSRDASLAHDVEENDEDEEVAR